MKNCASIWLLTWLKQFVLHNRLVMVLSSLAHSILSSLAHSILSSLAHSILSSLAHCIISEGTFLSNALRCAKRHCYLEGSQATPVCPSGNSSVQVQMRMEQRSQAKPSQSVNWGRRLAPRPPVC